MTPNLVNGDPQSGHNAPPANVLDTLRHLRARSPQESLGLQTQRGLLKAFLLATVGTSMVFAALTVVPYLMHKAKPADEQPTPAAAGVNEPAMATTPSSTPPADQTAKAPPTDTGKPKAKGKDLPDVLGESGVKTGSPKVNPLDKKDDDIFKELCPK